VCCDGAGNIDSLPLATAELFRVGTGQVASKSYGVEEVIDCPRALASLRSMNEQWLS